MEQGQKIQRLWSAVSRSRFQSQAHGSQGTPTFRFRGSGDHWQHLFPRSNTTPFSGTSQPVAKGPQPCKSKTIPAILVSRPRCHPKRPAGDSSGNAECSVQTIPRSHIRSRLTFLSHKHLPKIRLMRNFSTRFTVPFLLLLLPSFFSPVTIAEDPPRLMMFQSGGQSWTGRVLARSDDGTWIMDPFGEVIHLAARDITHLEVAAPVFRSASVDAFLDRLRGELPHGYQVTASRHFVIAAPSGKLAPYKDIFEDVFSEICGFLAARNLQTAAPALPLVALVFTNQKHFRDYCQRDNTPWSQDLRGYYSLKTNRVVVLDAASDFLAPGTVKSMERPGSQSPARLSGGTLSVRTIDTIIHETTHQIGFNTGIHSRFGLSPQWLVEGLALHLESSQVRTRGHGRILKPSEQINPERLEWFRREYSRRRTLGDVAALVASDEFFKRHSFDAYSLSWALTCYLSTGRSKDENAKFPEYVKKLAGRDPFESYSEEQRLSDFRSAFGDPAMIEQELLRFLDDMSPGIGVANLPD